MRFVAWVQSLLIMLVVAVTVVVIDMAFFRLKRLALRCGKEERLRMLAKSEHRSLQADEKTHDCKQNGS